jgi:hypothetical protein
VAIGRVIVPASLAGPPPLTRFRGRAARAGVTLHAAPPLAVLWPPANAVGFTPAPGVTADNAGSLVLACGAARGRALLMADVDSTVESRLDVAAPIGVLKAGHHGSGTSSGAVWLARIRPRFAVLSCGRRNRFGHPDPGTVARLLAAGASIERTDVSGARWYELSESGARLIDWAAGNPGRYRLGPPACSPCGAQPPARP